MQMSDSLLNCQLNDIFCHIFSWGKFSIELATCGHEMFDFNNHYFAVSKARKDFFRESYFFFFNLLKREHLLEIYGYLYEFIKSNQIICTSYWKLNNSSHMSWMQTLHSLTILYFRLTPHKMQYERLDKQESIVHKFSIEHCFRFADNHVWFVYLYRSILMELNQA